MNVTQKQINRFIELTKLAVYDTTGDSESGPGDLKREYKNLGRRILTAIAEGMGLQKGEYDIRWNPGGIACSGDHTLHTDKVYVALHDNIGCGWFYWRTVTGRKDYTGGANQIVNWNHLRQYGIAPLINSLKIAQAGGYFESNGDFNMNPGMVLRQANRALMTAV